MTDAPGSPPADATVSAAPLDELVADLAREGRAPGVGSVSAAVTAMAAAVVAMTARSSDTVWAEARGAVAQADALRRRALPLAAADAEALERALAVLEGRTAAEGRAEQRDFSLGLVLAAAADVPLAIAEVATDVAGLAAAVAEAGSPEVRPDAVGAALLASGAARAAAHLVEVNLATTENDARVRSARALAAEAARLAEAALAVRD